VVVDPFADTEIHEEVVEVGAAPVELPIRYERADVFMALHTVRYQSALRLVPEALRPVRLGGDRAVLAISALRYRECTLGQYGEVMIGVACTSGAAPPGLLTVALQSALPGFGYYIVHLPVTSERAREVGRDIWGLPKFVAAMDFTHTDEDQSVRLAESGEEILSLRVRRRGAAVRDRRPWVIYSTRGTRLLRTTILTRTEYQVSPGGGGATLLLGDHPIATELRRLCISPTALLSLSYRSFHSLLPRGRVIGEVEALPPRVADESELAGVPVPRGVAVR
jgi:hypothetical protein